MIQCKNDCPRGVYEGCCRGCPEWATCPDSCQEEPVECGNSVFEEENALAEFKETQLDTLKAIAALTEQKKAIEEQEKTMKAVLYAAMEKFGVKKFESDLLTLTYVAPTTSTGVDSAKLKKKHPEIYAECSKTTSKAGYVKITLKDGEKNT